jgi:glyoxylase-like metal-dependent hydrolase (beta-lactamase superfamily II)
MTVDFGKGGVADVGDGVFVYVGPEGDSNNGIVLTGEGTISIDSYVKQYAGLAGALEKVCDRPVRLAINTHDDADHYSMNHFFRRQGAMIIASEVCRSRIEKKMGMASWVDDLRRRNPALAHELRNPGELVPHVGLQDRATLKIAGERIELMHMGHGHCPGDLIVNFPERGVLFGGDLVFAGVHGRLKTADVDSLIAMLGRLADIPCKTVIPGHGAPLQGVGREAIETYRDYLVVLRDRIAELILNGVSAERVATGLKGWKYDKWGREKLFPVCAQHVYKDVAWRLRFSLDNPAQIMTRAAASAPGSSAT